MGAIVDRSKEHLGPADKAIIQMRKLLLQAARTVQEAAPRARQADVLRAARVRRRAGRDAAWRDILTPEMAGTEMQTV